MSDLQALLMKRSEDIEKPPPLPVGPYMGSVVSTKFTKASTGTEGVELTWVLSAAHESIDPALLEGVKVAGRQIRESVWLTEDALWRLMGDQKKGVKGLAQILGIDVTGKNVFEVINELPGRQCLLGLILKPSKDGKEMYTNVGDHTAV